jgi:hypothetical protein
MIALLYIYREKSLWFFGLKGEWMRGDRERPEREGS